MASNIDQRIVQMQFENAQFERNIAKSKKSLADFKKELNFSEVSRGMMNFFDKMKDFSFDKIANGVQALADRFTGLGNVAEMVTNQIRNKIEGVISSMSRFVDSMTTAQISAGKDKYEMLNKSVQTIKNATGKSEEEVYTVMEKLNKYTDMTSYDFADMANNIGKFTSVGKGLGESERAMEGIANWAALSGAGIQEASRAMYNISQAMGVGKMTLMDWKSIQNANMATMEFKQAAIDAAVAAGDLEKTTDKSGNAIYKTAKKYGKQTEVTLQNFQETLNKGWFTDDVMMKVLERFADTTDELGAKAYEAAQKCTTFTDVITAWRDQISTGWMNSFRFVFGDLTESMSFFSDVCNKVADDLGVLIDTRNDILKGWADLGGRTDLFASLLGDYGEGIETGAYGIIDIIHDVGSLIADTFWDMLKTFTPGDVSTLWDDDDGKWRIAWIVKELKKFTDGFQKAMQSIRTFFSEDVDIGGQTTTRLEMVQNMLHGIAGVFIYVYNVIEGIVSFFGKIKEQLTPSFLAIEYLFSQLGAAIFESAGQENKNKGILGFFNTLAELTRPLTSAINSLVIRIVNLIIQIINWGNQNGVFEKIGNGIKSLWETLIKFASPIVDFFGTIIEAAGDLFANGINTDSLKAIGVKLKEAFKTMLKTMLEALPESMTGFKEAIYDLFGLWGAEEGVGRDNIFTKIHDFFTGGIEKVKALFEDGTIAGIWDTIKGFFSSGLEKAEGGISAVFDWFANFNLGDSIRGVFSGVASVLGWLIDRFKDQNLFTLLKAILGVVAVVKLFKLISSINKVSEGIGEFFKNPLGALFGGQEEKGGFSTVVEKILDIAKAIALVAATVIVLGAIPTAQLVKGGLALAAIMGIVVGFVALINQVSGTELKDTLNYVAIAAMALSIGMIVAVLLPLTLVSWEGLAKMMVGLAGILAQLVGVMLLTSYLPIGTKQLGGFIGFAASIAILVLSLLPLTLVSWEGFAKMMVGLAGILLQLIGVMLIVTYLPIGTASLGGFIGFAASIAILVLSLLPLTAVSWEGFAKMMAGLGGVLLELVGFMMLVTYLPIGTASLGGFIGFAASIAILVLSLLPLANINWEGYAKMMAGLGGVLALMLVFAGIVSTIKMDPGSMAEMILFAGALSIVMLAFGASLSMVKGMDWGVILAFAGGMTALMLGMAAAMAIAAATPFAAGVKGILLIAAGIVVLIGALSMMIPVLAGSIGDSLTGLSSKLEIVSSLLGGFATKMGEINEGDINKAGTILDKLKELMGKLFGWGKFTGSIDDFSYTMFALGTGMEIFNNHAGNALGTLGGNAEAAIGFIQSLSECASGLDTITKMNMDVLVGKISALGGALYIFARGAKEAEGLGSVEGETPDITGGLRLIQAINESFKEDGGFIIPSNMPSSDELSTFGAQLAALAAGLVLFEEAGAGLGSGTDKALETLDFFQKLKAKLVATEFAKELGAAIGIFSADNVTKEELTQFGTNIEQLGLALKQFAASVTYIDATTGEIKDLNFDNAIKALEAFQAIDDKLGFEFGPIIQFIAGKRKDLGDLSAEINKLGTALSLFGEKLSGVDENGNLKFDEKLFTDAITVVDNIADELLKLQGEFDRVGGIIPTLNNALYGHKFDFKDLKEQLVALGDGLRSLGGLTTGENRVISLEEFQGENGKSGIDDLLDALIEYMNGLKDKTHNVGGAFLTLKNVVIGRDFDFTDLRTQLVALGDGLRSLSGLNTEGNEILKVEELGPIFALFDDILAYLGKLNSSAKRVGGIYNVVNTALNGREFDFTDLEPQLKALGSGLNSISGINVDTNGNTIFNAEGRGAALDTVDALITYMTSLNEKLGRVGGISEWFENLWQGKEADFEYVGVQLGYLGDGLGKFSAGLTKEGSFNGTDVEAAIASLDNIVSIIQKMRTFSEEFYTVEVEMNKYTTPLRMENMSEWVARMADMMRYINTSTSINPNAPSIVQSLVDFIWSFDDALNERGGLKNMQSAGVLEQVTNSLVNLISATKGMTLENGTIADFTDIGTQICNGVIKGIIQGQSAVATTAENMAIAAYKAAKIKLGIKSPSKLFGEIGGYVAAGMALGMTNGTGMVVSSSEAMANGAINSAADVISMMGSMLDEDIDANPTISPVLDLGAFNIGMNTLQKEMTGNTMSIDTSMSGRYAMNSLPNRSTQEINQNGSDYSGLYTRIEQAVAQIEELGTQISQMKIVLDSGVVAGGVSKGVDDYMGRQMFYASRNN